MIIVRKTKYYNYSDDVVDDVVDDPDIEDNLS